MDVNSLPSPFQPLSLFLIGENIHKGNESITDVAVRFASTVHETNIGLNDAVDALNRLINQMRDRGGFITPQREGLARKRILSTFLLELQILNNGKKLFPPPESPDAYTFEEAISLLGESVFPSPESVLIRKTRKAGYIVNVHPSLDNSWDVEIVDNMRENSLTISKKYLEGNFRNGKILNREVTDEEIADLFSQNKQ